MFYDDTNIFAKIIRGEIPCRKIDENDYALAFYDAYPKTPIHILVIPKNAYSDSVDFYQRAGDTEIAEFYRLIGRVIDGLDIRQNGFRLVSNSGKDAHQEVPHFHVHILAGRALGPSINFS